MSSRMGRTDVDVDGNEIPEYIGRFLEELQTRTMCRRAVCNWHKDGLVQYWGKRRCAGPEVFKVAAKHGFRVTIGGSRENDMGNEKTRAYFEFRPIELEGVDR